jgi:hypothetical protein
MSAIYAQNVQNLSDLRKISVIYGRQRWFYLDVFACGFLDTSKNVPEAPARARQCRPTGRRAQGIFGAERPSTRPNEVVVRAAGKTCCRQYLRQYECNLQTTEGLQEYSIWLKPVH